jgi:hypothetical protein
MDNDAFMATGAGRFFGASGSDFAISPPGKNRVFELFWGFLRRFGGMSSKK